MPHPVTELMAARAEAGSRPGHRSDDARLALVIEGGGMRGAVTGGMTAALHALGLREAFDDVYGASAGTLNGAWFAGDMASDVLHTWADPELRMAAVRRRNPLRGRPLVDGRYLTEVIYEVRTPMPFEAIVASDVVLHPLATDAATGDAVDLAPLAVDRPTLKAAIRASTALPLLSGRPVQLGGRHFFDAGLAEAVPFRTAIAQGATHLLILRSRRAGEQETGESGRTSALVARYLARYSTGLAAAFLARPARLIADDAELDARQAGRVTGVHVLSIRPGPDTPRISRLERDHQRVLTGLQAGDAAVRAALA